MEGGNGKEEEGNGRGGRQGLERVGGMVWDGRAVWLVCKGEGEIQAVCVRVRV